MTPKEKAEKNAAAHRLIQVMQMSFNMVATAHLIGKIPDEKQREASISTLGFAHLANLLKLYPEGSIAVADIKALAKAFDLDLTVVRLDDRMAKNWENN